MNKKQIKKLALETYPIKFDFITIGNNKGKIDINKKNRIAFIEGLKKATEFHYTEDQIIQAINIGRNALKDNKNIIRNSYLKTNTKEEAEIEITKQLLNIIK